MSNIKNKELTISKFISEPPDLMLDVGVGPKSEYLSLASVYPNMKIVGFEPHPFRFISVLRKFNGLLLPYAIWDKNETVEIYSNTEEAAMFDPPSCFRYNDSQVSVSMEAKTLDWVLDYMGDFKNILLWMDIEGAELKALQGAPKTLDRVKYINVELCDTPLYEGSCDGSQVDSFLTNAGFELVHSYQFSVGIDEIKFHDAIYIRR